MNRTSRPTDLVLQRTTAVSSPPPPGGPIENPEPSPSTTASGVLSDSLNLLNVSPAPAYIASSAAARLVTSDHEPFFRSLRADGVVCGPGTPTLYVSSGSLALVNQFLDFLLYSFLSNSKSTSLSALRPAITDVLRIRLAREALAGADQELKSYLGGDGEDIESFDDVMVAESTGEGWIPDLAWKKCRVQCMVYSSLGDLEEDDEAFYTDNGGLEGAVGLEQYQRRSNNPGIVTPAVAIWLTSILEFIGEQTLLVAGHATIARYSIQRIAAASGPSSEASSEMTFPEKPTVEELDTEKVALNPSLGRMWRQWRKRVRSGRGSFSAAPREIVPNRLESMAIASNRPKISSEEAATNHDNDKGESTPTGNKPPVALSGSDIAVPAVETVTPDSFATSRRLVPDDVSFTSSL